MISQLIQGIFKHIDTFLMGCLLFTMLVGLFVLYSASGHSFERVNSQIINIAVALGVMWIIANIQPQHLERVAPPLYLLGVLLLIAVEIFGHISHGAQRWLAYDAGVVFCQARNCARCN
jgi:rod shape determining protein RodA